MFPVRYELRFYIPEDGILHNHRRKNPKHYIITVCLKNLKPETLGKENIWKSL
jgi:hypothetical protein